MRNFSPVLATYIVKVLICAALGGGTETNMTKRSTTLTVYTLSHFAVDFGCGWLMYALYGGGALSGANAFLLYNFLAFGLQFVIGAVIDVFRERGRLYHCEAAYVGCVLVMTALLLGTHAPLIAVTLVGLGNAAFHVGGGTDSLLYARGKMGRCGIFVSSGAVGVSLGMLCGARFGNMTYIPATAAAFCALLILFLGKCREDMTTPADAPYPSPLCAGGLGLVLCLFAVLVRSYAGFLFSMPWKQGFWLVLLAAAAALVGKAAGGLLADKLGARAVGTVSLLASVPLVIFGRESMSLSGIGIVCFNIAMPITLHTAAARLRGREGFAFGLTTLALLIGYLLFTFIELPTVTAFVTVAVTGVLAAGAIYLSSPGRGGKS